MAGQTHAWPSGPIHSLNLDIGADSSWSPFEYARPRPVRHKENLVRALARQLFYLHAIVSCWLGALSMEARESQAEGLEEVCI